MSSPIFLTTRPPPRSSWYESVSTPKMWCKMVQRVDLRCGKLGGSWRESWGYERGVWWTILSLHDIQAGRKALFVNQPWEGDHGGSHMYLCQPKQVHLNTKSLDFPANMSMLTVFSFDACHSSCIWVPNEVHLLVPTLSHHVFERAGHLRGVRTTVSAFGKHCQDAYLNKLCENLPVFLTVSGTIRKFAVLLRKRWKIQR